MLRLGKEYTEDERKNRVDEILNFVRLAYFQHVHDVRNRRLFQLNLTKSENTTIGIPGIVKGLSGGEKRRLTFATEVCRRAQTLANIRRTIPRRFSAILPCCFAMNPHPVLIHPWPSSWCKPCVN